VFLGRSAWALPPRGTLLSGVLTILLAVAAGAGAASLEDMQGRPVPVPGGPIRLVSLAPSLTEIVFALGRGDWLVGVSDYCDYPPPARALPRMGGILTPNLERIVQARPGLVLVTAEGNSMDGVSSLTRLGLPVFMIRPEGMAGVLASIGALGQALHTEAAATALSDQIQGKLAHVRELVRGRGRPRVLFLLWASPLMAVAPGTYIHDLIETAGGVNVVRDRRAPYPRIGWEQVIAWAPDVIVLPEHREGESQALPEQMLRAWRTVPAVRTGRVVSVPSDPIYRPGPRIVEGVERLARAIHPESFPPAAPRDAARTAPR
jgi:ABC-type Fe3+-hydroxamate transport system substrate-binding protein